jgi:hypothetical protein
MFYELLNLLIIFKTISTELYNHNKYNFAFLFLFLFYPHQNVHLHGKLILIQQIDDFICIMLCNFQHLLQSLSFLSIFLINLI